MAGVIIRELSKCWINCYFGPYPFRIGGFKCDIKIRQQLQNTAFFVALRRLYTGTLKEVLAAKEVAAEGLILGLREAMVLPSDEELYGRFEASMSGNERQMLPSDL